MIISCVAQEMGKYPLIDRAEHEMYCNRVYAEQRCY